MSKTKLKFGVLAVNGMVMGAGVTTPVLADIMKAFPTVNPTTVMLISGLPSLLVLLAPLYGKLTQYFPKKTLLAFATLCFVIGGFLPAFLTNFTLILAMRALLGVGLAFIMPMASDLVSDFFEGHERETMMGFQSASASIGGILYQLAGGYLGAIRWNYAFYAYLAGIIVFLAVYLTLPEPERKVMPKGEKAKMSSQAYFSFVSLFFYNMIFFILINNTAVMLVGEKIADAAAIGIAFTLMTVGALVGGFFAGKVMQIFKGFAFTLLYIIFAIGFGVGYMSHSLTMFFAAAIIIGLVMGTLIPAYWVKISNSVPPPMIALGISIGVSAMNLGGFVQPYVYDLVRGIFNLQIGRQAFAAGAVASLIMAVVVLVEAFSSKRQSAPEVAYK